MAPELELFGRGDTETEPRKIGLGSIPNEDGFCSLDTKHDRRKALRRLKKQTPQELRSQTRKT
jgi:hypothetical protein